MYFFFTFDYYYYQFSIYKNINFLLFFFISELHNNIHHSYNSNIDFSSVLKSLFS